MSHSPLSRFLLDRTPNITVSSCSFHLDTSGATTVEHAVVVMLVLIGTLIGLDLLNDSVHHAFDSVSHSMEDAQGEHPTLAEADATADRPAPRVTASAKKKVVVAVTFGRAVVLILSGLLFLFIVWRIWAKSANQRVDEQLRSQTDEIPASVIFEKRHQILTILFKDIERVHRCELQVGQVMTRRIKSVLPTTPVEELKQIVWEQKKRHLLVCDSTGELLGVISDRDLLGREGEVAKDLMTPNPMTVQRDALLDPAVTMLIQKRISCLPVMHEGRLCGLLTTTDVMMALQCVSQVMQRLRDEDIQGRQLTHDELLALEHAIEDQMAGVPQPA